MVGRLARAALEPGLALQSRNGQPLLIAKVHDQLRSDTIIIDFRPSASFNHLFGTFSQLDSRYSESSSYHCAAETRPRPLSARSFWAGAIMSPTKPEPKPEAVPQHEIDKTPEYVEFMQNLKDYHTKRGTALDPEPKVGNSYVDLYKVFNHIVKNGGYDKVSEEKLAWRRMAAELGIYSSNEASTAFSLKEKFYKNLAAYEISVVHKKEPPPKEILEHVTAKGAGLLTRTKESFRGLKRESNTAGGDSAASGDDATPSREKPSVDTPASSARASRGLREAPPQRVIFQPDTGTSRPMPARHNSGQQPQNVSSPATGPNATQPSGPGQPSTTVPLPQAPPQSRAPRGASSVHTPQGSDHISTVVGSYEPRLNVPIPLRPVDTPGNNPGAFPRLKPPPRTAADVERAALASESLECNTIPF